MMITNSEFLYNFKKKKSTIKKVKMIEKTTTKNKVINLYRNLNELFIHYNNY